MLIISWFNQRYYEKQQRGLKSPLNPNKFQIKRMTSLTDGYYPYTLTL